MVESKKKAYAELSTTEKWVWHADAYAFRMVVLGEREPIECPCDPERIWYNEEDVLAAAQRMVERMQGQLSKAKLAYFRERLCMPESWCVNAKREIEEAEQRRKWERAAELRKERGWRKVGDVLRAGDLGVTAEPVEPASIPIPDGQADYLKSILANRLGKATGEAAE